MLSEVAMALNIKNAEVERLVEEVARLAGETKTEAVRRSLEERRGRLRVRVAADDRGQRLLRFLEEEVWPTIPAKVRRKRLSKAEKEAILGYGEDGV
jgi:antitoxin VapB